MKKPDDEKRPPRPKLSYVFGLTGAFEGVTIWTPRADGRRGGAVFVGAEHLGAVGEHLVKAGKKPPVSKFKKPTPGG